MRLFYGGCMEVKAKGISIKYRLPSIPQKLRLLSKMGLTPDMGDSGSIGYDAMAAIIEVVDELGLIESISVKHGNKVLTTWSELLDVVEMTEYVMEVVGNILNPPSSESLKK